MYNSRVAFLSRWNLSTSTVFLVLLRMRTPYSGHNSSLTVSVCCLLSVCGMVMCMF